MAEAVIRFRKTAVLGPFKVEIVRVQSPATGDYIISDLTRPEFVAASTSPDDGDDPPQVANPYAWHGAGTDIRKITIGLNDATTDITLFIMGF